MCVFAALASRLHACCVAAIDAIPLDHRAAVRAHVHARPGVVVDEAIPARDATSVSLEAQSRKATATAYLAASRVGKVRIKSDRAKRPQSFA